VVGALDLTGSGSGGTVRARSNPDALDENRDHKQHAGVGDLYAGAKLVLRYP